MTVVLTAVALAFASADGAIGFLQGKWRIGKKSYCPGMCAMTKAQARALRGRALEYSADLMSNGEQACHSPRYAEQKVSADDFFRDYRCAPTDIGLKGKMVTTISISCAERRAGWPAIGDLALVKDSNTFLTLWDGVFFEVHRE